MIAILALEDGRVFHGESFGATGTTTGEVCFNTSMTGYQEILTDLVAALGLQPGMILIEHNGQATRRADWPHTPLAENDRIEILQVAAGG